MPAKALTYSRNVFIPVTNVCRNRCGYCCFRSEKGNVISKEDASHLLDLGSRAGCTEALFSLGERPWEVPNFHNLFKGHLIDYLIELYEMALDLGLLPHTNAGILDVKEMELLAPYNASMGLMLETTAKVEAHQHSPGKDPQTRIDAIAAAGELKIPFTTGILVGIGERPADRIESLKVLAHLHNLYGHLQEVIIQPFDPKPETFMELCSPPSLQDMIDTVKLARGILPSSIAVQVPPNLIKPAPLVKVGATDLGGISPLTSDWINPQRPWPQLQELRDNLPGYVLKERLPVYPNYVDRGWHGERTKDLVYKMAGPDGLVLQDES